MDEGGHQMAHIEYPGLPTDYVMEMVHRFYDEYYFRPKAAFRVVWKAIVNRDVPRLYVEAKAFLKLRAQRNKMVKATRASRQTQLPLQKPVHNIPGSNTQRGRRNGDRPLLLTRAFFPTYLSS
jgi:hypothetical protein